MNWSLSVDHYLWLWVCFDMGVPYHAQISSRRGLDLKKRATALLSSACSGKSVCLFKPPVASLACGLQAGGKESNGPIWGCGEGASPRRGADSRGVEA